MKFHDSNRYLFHLTASDCNCIILKHIKHSVHLKSFLKYIVHEDGYHDQGFKFRLVPGDTTRIYHSIRRSTLVLAVPVASRGYGGLAGRAAAAGLQVARPRQAHATAGSLRRARAGPRHTASVGLQLQGTVAIEILIKSYINNFNQLLTII